jgi:hypothetical protein
MSLSHIRFITFGSHSNYIEAGKRLYNQAISLQLFHKLQLYTFIDLQKDTEFYEKNSEFILHNKRGCGYWLWKPYLIHKNMNDMQNGDILLYLDCGCELDVHKKNKIIKLFHLVKKHKIITSYTEVEANWNKMDLLFRLNAMNSPQILTTPQKEAGAIIILVCDETRKLVKDWYELAISNNYHFIDDSPSIKQNILTFKEHRHDQSIFSLLVKKYGLCNWINICDYVSYKRNKTGKSLLGVKNQRFNLSF